MGRGKCYSDQPVSRPTTTFWLRAKGVEMSGPIICTPDNPWKEGDGYPVQHEGCHEVSDSQENGWPGGDIVRMICPNCGVTWTKELPQ